MNNFKRSLTRLVRNQASQAESKKPRLTPARSETSKDMPSLMPPLELSSLLWVP